MVNMISRIIRVMAEPPHLWQVMRLVCPLGGNVTAWHGHWTVVKLGGHSTVFVSNYRLTFRLFILYLLSVCSLFALIKSKYFLIFMIDTTWGVTYYCSLHTCTCSVLRLTGLADLEVGLASPPAMPPRPHLGLFPLGFWSCSMNSLCLSDGLRSHRNLSKNFFRWDWESSLDLREPAPDLFMKAAGSMAWNSNRARDPITWFGGRNFDKDVKLSLLALHDSDLEVVREAEFQLSFGTSEYSKGIKNIKNVVMRSLLCYYDLKFM